MFLVLVEVLFSFCLELIFRILVFTFIHKKGKIEVTGRSYNLALNIWFCVFYGNTCVFMAYLQYFTLLSNFTLLCALIQYA